MPSRSASWRCGTTAFRTLLRRFSPIDSRDLGRPGAALDRFEPVGPARRRLLGVEGEGPAAIGPAHGRHRGPACGHRTEPCPVPALEAGTDRRARGVAQPLAPVGLGAPATHLGHVGDEVVDHLGRRVDVGRDLVHRVDHGRWLCRPHTTPAIIVRAASVQAGSAASRRSARGSRRSTPRCRRRRRGRGGRGRDRRPRSRRAWRAPGRRCPSVRRTRWPGTARRSSPLRSMRSSATCSAGQPRPVSQSIPVDAAPDGARRRAARAPPSGGGRA